jgi:hypothetical protein
MRTESLRRFAMQFGLLEVFATIHPTITPSTYIASAAPGARRSWIDHVLASSELLTEGHIQEAGILMHESLNSSDHRGYMFEITLPLHSRSAPHMRDSLCLSPGWQSST